MLKIIFHFLELALTYRRATHPAHGANFPFRRSKDAGRQKMFFFPGLLLSTVFFCSCTPKPIDIEIEPYNPRLVVASQIFPDQIMFVALSRSFSALSNSTEEDTVPSNFLDSVLVEDALVTVSYFGNTDTLFMITPGIYASVNTLQYNYGFYTLYAKDPKTGQEVTANSIILPQVKFDTIYPIVNKTINDTTVKVNFEFTDLPEKNWYAINYYMKSSDGGAGFDINTYFSPGSNKVLTALELLSDQTFASSKYVGETILGGITAEDTIAVAISNISEGYYQFLSAYKRSGNVFNQLMGEPINYPSNVQNGHGYFNTHYPDVRIFDLKDY